MRGSVGKASMTLMVALLACLAVGVLWTAGSRATTLEPLTVAQLSRRATAVVEGTVASVAVRQSPSGVRTAIRIRVERALKGARPRFMTVFVPGGVLPDGTEVRVGGMPAFAVGESCVVFVDVRGWVVGGFQGKFDVAGGRIAGTGESLSAFGHRVDRALGRRTTAYGGRPQPDPAAGRTDAGLRRVSPAAAAATSMSAPTIDAIDPDYASAGTGTLVTLSGSGFGKLRGDVLFSYGRDGVMTISTSSVKSWSDTSVRCVVPTGVIDDYDASAGTGPVVVVTALGVESNSVDLEVPFGYGAAKWAASSARYVVNTSGVDGVRRESLVDAGANAWNAVDGGFQFKDGGTSTAGFSYDGLNVISWADGLPEGVLAWTQSDVRKGVMKESDVQFSNAIPWGDGSPGSGTYDIQSISTHELGHWLCLLDQYMPGDSQKIMYGLGDYDEQRRTPTADDIAGMEWIYSGVGPSPTPTPTTSPTPNPGDTVGPVCSAQNATVRRGHVCKIKYSVYDEGSLLLFARVEVQTGTGLVKKAWEGMTASSNAWQTVSFRCLLAKGTYDIVVTGEDMSGNSASVVGAATLRVK